MEKTDIQPVFDVYYDEEEDQQVALEQYPSDQ